VALSELDPTGRFGDRASDYVKYRPSYPAAAIDAVLAGLGSPASLHAADIGAGTGISARLLGDRGVRVIAVEPNAPMRAAAAPHPNVTFHDGTAEATGLDDGSFDLVLCAQSFHWFRPEPALKELRRVLRPSGRLALMWNRRAQSDPFTAGYRDAILAVGGESAAERMEFAVSRSPLASLLDALVDLRPERAAPRPLGAHRPRAERLLRSEARPERGAFARAPACPARAARGSRRLRDPRVRDRGLRLRAVELSSLLVHVSRRERPCATRPSSSGVWCGADALPCTPRSFRALRPRRSN
jgi:SAM-dependent methyltransferase